MDTSSKVMTRVAARSWRTAQGGRVVFTNGVFDILHPGHVQLLEAARALGDVLVVGINTDASVRRLGKAPDRPINAVDVRARMLAALAAVSAVTVFDEDTPYQLIGELEPDILVKGADYQPGQIVGADLVERRGGQVVRVPLVPGQSTTTFLERLRAPS